MTLTFIFQASAAAIDSVSKAKIELNAQKFTEIDPWGVGITFIGMTVVFMSLLILYLFFFNISKGLNARLNRKLKKSGAETAEAKIPAEASAEVNAAIATAIHLYLSELHDNESAILTINKVARTYSPWSSKIYGIRQFSR
ncbi:MAG: OadG family protein [Melioribacteraceae bacterium]